MNLEILPSENQGKHKTKKYKNKNLHLAALASMTSDPSNVVAYPGIPARDTKAAVIPKTCYSMESPSTKLVAHVRTATVALKIIIFSLLKA